MLKKLALTSAVATILAAPVMAQTSSTTGPATTAPRPMTASPSANASQIDAHKLIGQSIQNEADSKTVGKIDSVMLDSAGKVQKVVVGVGGFLGIGKKDVAIDWSQIHVADNGRKVSMAANKDQLKAMPEYVWPKEHARGSVWTAADGDRRVAPPAATTSSGSAGTSGMAPSTGTSQAPIDSAPRTAPTR